MDRDTIIRLAQEAGLPYMYQTGEVANLELVERFAALVVANNPPQSWMTYQLGLEAGKQAGATEERKRIVDMLLDMHAQEERHNYFLFISNIIKESAWPR